jgi:hypothetical protein
MDFEAVRFLSYRGKKGADLESGLSFFLNRANLRGPCLGADNRTEINFRGFFSTHTTRWLRVLAPLRMQVQPISWINSLLVSLSSARDLHPLLNPSGRCSVQRLGSDATIQNPQHHPWIPWLLPRCIRLMFAHIFWSREDVLLISNQ